MTFLRGNRRVGIEQLLLAAFETFSSERIQEPSKINLVKIIVKRCEVK
jgi:hypothetical protein